MGREQVDEALARIVFGKHYLRTFFERQRFRRQAALLQSCNKCWRAKRCHGECVPWSFEFRQQFIIYSVDICVMSKELGRTRRNIATLHFAALYILVLSFIECVSAYCSKYRQQF